VACDFGCLHRAFILSFLSTPLSPSLPFLQFQKPSKKKGTGSESGEMMTHAPQYTHPPPPHTTLTIDLLFCRDEETSLPPSFLRTNPPVGYLFPIIGLLGGGYIVLIVPLSERFFRCTLPSTMHVSTPAHTHAHDRIISALHHTHARQAHYALFPPRYSPSLHGARTLLSSLPLDQQCAATLSLSRSTVEAAHAIKAVCLPVETKHVRVSLPSPPRPIEAFRVPCRNANPNSKALSHFPTRCLTRTLCSAY
jgi:hypothetical protein